MRIKRILVVLAAILTLSCTACRPNYKNTQAVYKIDDNSRYSASAEVFAEFKAVDEVNHTIQGGWFDGKYFYVCMYKSDAVDSRIIFTKIDLEGNIVKKSDYLDLDHANNVTYNPKINKFVITHCQSRDEDRSADYSFVDPNTFKVTKTGTLQKPFFAMAYCASKDMYASGEWAGQVIDTWDGNMKVLHSYDAEVSDTTTSQGVFADDEHIWFVRSGNGENSPQMRVFDWEGNLTHVIEIPDIPVEPESITIVNGEIYIICNNAVHDGGIVYKLILNKV